MANLDFKPDLKLGNDGETVVRQFLETNGCKFINSNNDNKYDIKMLTNNIETTYEIKTDVFVAPKPFDSGNIFIELESRGKLSGINTTQAKWFVTYFLYLNELWFIETTKLKKLIQDNNFMISYNAGDIGSGTHGYLIKRDPIRSHFHVHKI